MANQAIAAFNVRSATFDEKNGMLAAAPLAGSDNSNRGSYLRQECGSLPEKIWNTASNSKFWGWVSWLFSVMVCGALLNQVLSYFEPSRVASSPTYIDHSTKTTPAASTMLKRVNTCGTGEQETGGDNLASLRIGGVFIILAVSFSACAFPLLCAKVPGLRMPANFFFGVRHFGTGVLLATAFCHLLPTAFTLLHDPCLDPFWNETYPAMPGAIALGAVIFVTAVEMYMHPGGHDHGPAQAPPPAEAAIPVAAQKQMGQFGGRSQSTGRILSFIERPDNKGHKHSASTSSVLTNDPEIQMWMYKNGSALSLATSPGLKSPYMADPKMPRSPFGAGLATIGEAPPPVPVSHGGLTPDQKRKREMNQCFLLEMGILFHSVFIGMALSVAVNSDFILLLIAISFHQTFEGLALGSRIAAIDWPAEMSVRPWLMCLAYGCTTPIGQAIGLATRSAYSPESEAGLLLVGIMNSISSGLLIFASLVELLAEDLLSDESWRVLTGAKRLTAFGLVIAGAFGMSLIGAWA